MKSDSIPDTDSGYSGKERRRGYDNIPHIREDIGRLKAATEATEMTVEKHTVAIDALVRSSIELKAAVDQGNSLSVDIKELVIGHGERIADVEHKQNRTKWWRAGFLGAIIALITAIKAKIITIIF